MLITAAGQKKNCFKCKCTQKKPVFEKLYKLYTFNSNMTSNGMFLICPKVNDLGRYKCGNVFNAYHGERTILTRNTNNSGKR
jgi:hypothetical protein